MRGQFTPNLYRIVGDVAYIALTDKQGNMVNEAMVDAVNLPRVLAFARWARVRGRQGAEYYAYSNLHRMQLHRLILDAPVDMLVDHRNSNGLDCRKQNLRLCDKARNMQNRRGAAKNSASGVRNVYWHKRIERWRVEMRAFGQKHSFGSYATLAEAEDVAIAERRRLMPFSEK